MGRRFADFLSKLRGDGRDPDRARLLAILSVNRELAKAADRRSLLLHVVDEAVALFGAERGFLLVAQKAAPGFSVAIARSLDREAVQHPERKLSTTIVQRSLGSVDGVFSDDAQEGDLGSSQSIADLKLRSVLSMPLVVGDDVLGCLYLDHRFQSGAFAEADLPWLRAFADQAAVAVHLHELLAQNKAQQEQLAAQNRALASTVAQQAEEIADLRQGLTRADLAHPFPELLGESPALLRALHLLDRVAVPEFAVLITGESGTGKELAARALHAASGRSRGPFVAVNIAAISPGLLESELFGHIKGAFTGADRARAGLLREASGGTLFLDEVAEMDLDLQAKLLRCLEDRKVRPVGSDREEPIDVRIVAATNRDVMAAVAAGRLREDLYFRLAVVTVAMPPLRERGDDVVLLAHHFLNRLAAAAGKPSPVVTPELAAALSRRRWPGNLRQLHNEMQRLWALSGTGVLLPSMLSAETGSPLGDAAPTTFDLGELERWAIAQALRQADGNKALAARLLGISRRTLYSKLGSPDADDKDKE